MKEITAEVLAEVIFTDTAEALGIVCEGWHAQGEKEQAIWVARAARILDGLRNECLPFNERHVSAIKLAFCQDEPMPKPPSGAPEEVRLKLLEAYILFTQSRPPGGVSPAFVDFAVTEIDLCGDKNPARLIAFYKRRLDALEGR